MARISRRQWRPMGAKRPSEAMQAISEKNADGSRLLALPPEIRNRIYRLVLGDGTIHIWALYSRTRFRHTVCLDQDSDDRKLKLADRCYGTEEREKLSDHCTENSDRLPMQFLRACRQVYTEAALIPYATNDFRITSTALTVFDRRMSSFQKKSIKALTVVCASWRNTFEKRLVQKFSSLQKLKIVVLHPYSVDISDVESFSGLPLRDISIIELRHGGGEIQSFDHQAVRTRLIDAGEKRKELEPVRQAKSQENAAKTREFYKTISKACDEEVRQAVQSGNARSVRAERRHKLRGDYT